MKNLNGTTIYHGKIFPDAVEGILGNPNSIRDFLFGIYGGDQEKLLVEIQKKEKSSDEKDFIKNQNARYYLTLDLKNNMTPTLLWKATQ